MRYFSIKSNILNNNSDFSRLRVIYSTFFSTIFLSVDNYLHELLLNSYNFVNILVLVHSVYF